MKDDLKLTNKEEIIDNNIKNYKFLKKLLHNKSDILKKRFLIDESDLSEDIKENVVNERVNNEIAKIAIIIVDIVNAALRNRAINRPFLPKNIESFTIENKNERDFEFNQNKLFETVILKIIAQDEEFLTNLELEENIIKISKNILNNLSIKDINTEKGEIWIKNMVNCGLKHFENLEKMAEITYNIYDNAISKYFSEPIHEIVEINKDELSDVAKSASEKDIIRAKLFFELQNVRLISANKSKITEIHNIENSEIRQNKNDNHINIEVNLIEIYDALNETSKFLATNINQKLTYYLQNKYKSIFLDLKNKKIYYNNERENSLHTMVIKGFLLMTSFTLKLTRQINNNLGIIVGVIFGSLFLKEFFDYFKINLKLGEISGEKKRYNEIYNNFVITPIKKDLYKGFCNLEEAEKDKILEGFNLQIEKSNKMPSSELNQIMNEVKIKQGQTSEKLGRINESLDNLSDRRNENRANLERMRANLAANRATLQELGIIPRSGNGNITYHHNTGVNLFSENEQVNNIDSQNSHINNGRER